MGNINISQPKNDAAGCPVVSCWQTWQTNLVKFISDKYTCRSFHLPNFLKSFQTDRVFAWGCICLFSLVLINHTVPAPVIMQRNLLQKIYAYNVTCSKVTAMTFTGRYITEEHVRCLTPIHHFLDIYNSYRTHEIDLFPPNLNPGGEKGR